MRILSITAKKFRIHDAVSVQLDPSLTVIVGPNEAGKSTLAEAAHYALFYRATMTGATRERIVSTLHGGPPEVEMEFEARGAQWRLLKRFSGPSGSVTLTAQNGQALTGAEAEEKLASLCGVAAAGSGKGGANLAARQWAHLWVRQGEAENDPLPDANAEKDTLLSRLQAEGGAALMQSEMDARCARFFSEQRAEIFTKTGQPKTDSTLGRAHREHETATAGRQAASASMLKLQQAMDDLVRAEDTMCACSVSLVELQKRKDTLDASLLQVAALREEEKKRTDICRELEEKHAHLLASDETIRKLSDRAATLTTRLSSAAHGLEPLDAARSEARRRHDSATRTAATAAAALSRARRARDLASNCLLYARESVRESNLKDRREQATILEEHLRSLQAELAAQPAISAESWQHIESLDQARLKAEHIAGAMAAGLEVLAADMPVRMGNEGIEPGSKHLITAETEVSVGDGVRLRITPGGGAGPATARKNLAAAGEALRGALAGLGLRSLEEGVEARVRNQEMDTRVRALKTRIQDAGLQAIETELAATGTALARARSQARVLVEDGRHLTLPKDPSVADPLLQDAEQKLAEAELADTAAGAELKDAVRAMENAEKAYATAVAARHSETMELAGFNAQLALLAETHGNEASRATALRTLAADSKSAIQVLAETRSALTALNPGFLESDATRIAEAITKRIEEKNEAIAAAALARGTLHAGQNGDPRELLQLAEAREAAAAANLALLERNAEAVRLLDDLFSQERQHLASQFTRPLAERVSGYLECVLGPGGRVDLDFAENSFGGLRVSRTGKNHGAFDFSVLSGGTRGQVSAAFRLGMAETLAPAHDGCLPVLFDDAFTHADAGRLDGLHRMLDLAARQGLQMIVLTCNPGAFDGLGAKKIILV